MRIEKLGIIGVGLIGGAVGMAARERGVAARVAGAFRRPESLEAALRAGAVDSGTLEVAEAVDGADLVILGTGVGLFGKLLSQALDALAPGAVVTDVGSTKGRVVRTCEEALASRGDVHFVGSHPLAGSEKRGPASAPLVELAGALCVVTRGESTEPTALDRVCEFWRDLDMEVEVLSPAEHDARLAAASHVPHVVAAALVRSLDEKDLAYAATGFRDATRIALGDPELWAQIAESNPDEIAARLRGFSAGLEEVAGWIEAGERDEITAFLGAAAERRSAMERGDAN